MKAQTFGVEVEGNHITRQKAAMVAADYFGTGRYEYTSGRNGYMTWSAWDQEGREWKFSRDVSIAGPDDEKCVLVTPILTYKDTDMFKNNRAYVVAFDLPMPVKIAYTAVALYPTIFSEDWAEDLAQDFYDDFFGGNIDASKINVFLTTEEIRDLAKS